VAVKHDFARKLRREQTDVERKLWLALRDRQFDGFKFRRQQPIGPYIADFVCFERKLIVELDGDQHGSEQGIAYDGARTRFLEAEGFHVLRFPNFEVIREFNAVLEAIERSLRATPPHPPLS
jgi:very-short-patch-repair endonuclease